jgi:biotin-[acetyl-CoA-carboxylase] ligase BirA-like protein
MQAFHVDTVDSTNEEAKRLWRCGRVERAGYVFARRQTAGKGSYGRSWISPEDAGIYLSVIESAPHDNAPPDTLFTLSAGVACADFVREATQLDVRLKPINDLYVDERKLGGILVESLLEAGRIEAVITGIGINTHVADRMVRRGGVDPVCLQEIMLPAEFEAMRFDAWVAPLARAILHWNQRCWKAEGDEIRCRWRELCIADATLPDESTGRP